MKVRNSERFPAVVNVTLLARKRVLRAWTRKLDSGCRLAMPGKVATSHVWLFEFAFKLIEIK